MNTIEAILSFIVIVPVALGAFAAGLFVLWLIGTALYYLICYGRLP